MKSIVLTGSIAFDYLMSFPGRFSEHILPEMIDKISLSFLVDSLVRRPGGIAANIAYTLALLDERPFIMATVGEDFEEQRRWLESKGVDTSKVLVIPGELTASFFVTTDEANAQIASFFPGAMAHASQLSFHDVQPKPDLAVISPNDPSVMHQYTMECTELGIPYLYDPSQQIVRLNKDELWDGIRKASLLFCNEYELGLIIEKTGRGAEELFSGLDFAVITRGEQGTDIFQPSGVLTVEAVPPAQIADPTGVGDAFRGGFLKGYLNGISLPVCGRMGALASSYCLESFGPQGHDFNLTDFIERYSSIFGVEAELSSLT